MLKLGGLIIGGKKEMIFKELTIGRTFNLGDFENFKIDLNVSFENEEINSVEELSNVVNKLLEFGDKEKEKYISVHEVKFDKENKKRTKPRKTVSF